MTTANDNKLVPVIDQKKDLQHLSQLETEIIEMKNGYKDLKIESPEDKNGYELVRAAIGKLRPKRTGLEAERKSVVKPYNDVVKHINEKYGEITDLILIGPGGETELKGKKEAIDTILEKQKEEEKRQEEQKINNRINELIAAGMVFDGNYYCIKDESLNIPETSIGVVDIRTMSDDLFKNYLQMVLDKAGKINAEKERVAEIQRKADIAKLEQEKKDKADFDRRKKELEDAEEKIRKQQDEIKLQQDKLDQQKREQEHNRTTAILRQRSATLVSIGLEYNEQNDSYDYKGDMVVSDASTISAYADEIWIDLVEQYRQAIQKKKDDAAEFLRKKEQEDKDRQALLEKERQAGLNDKQKMKEYTDALKAVPVPQLTTKTWKTKAAAIRDVIADNSPA